MKKSKGRHRQSKYLTIMLVPDSTSKVRSIRIPRWVFSVVMVPLLCVAIIVTFFRAQVVSLEDRLYDSFTLLDESIDRREKLERTLIYIETAIQEQSDEADEKANELLIEVERQVEQLHEKTETIDGIKQEIIGVFNDLAQLDIPFSFDETLLRTAPYNIGGQRQGDVAEQLTELNAVLLNDIYDMRALQEYAGELETFFRYRPSGWPVASRRVTSEFGHRRNPFTGQSLEFHSGIDIAAPAGAQVYATAYGVVSFAGWSSSGYGILVVIEHGFDYSTYYAHNSRVLVSEGDNVARGQVIALVGSTGRSTGPHSHYEVRLRDVPQNPRRYLG